MGTVEREAGGRGAERQRRLHEFVRHRADGRDDDRQQACALLAGGLGDELLEPIEVGRVAPRGEIHKGLENRNRLALQAARDHLDPAQLIVVAVGDKAKVLPQLKAIGREAELRDAQGQP